MSWCKINQQKFYLLWRRFDLIIITEDSFCTLQPFHIGISCHSKTTMMLSSAKCQQHHQNSFSDGFEFCPDKKTEESISFLVFVLFWRMSVVCTQQLWRFWFYQNGTRWEKTTFKLMKNIYLKMHLSFGSHCDIKIWSWPLNWYQSLETQWRLPLSKI